MIKVGSIVQWTTGEYHPIGLVLEHPPGNYSSVYWFKDKFAAFYRDDHFKVVVP